MSFLVSLASLMANGAMAEDGPKHVCKQGKAERSVSVNYAEEGKKVPCSVKYKRDSDAEEKELYKAAAETGYCETKAEELVQKLSGLGWECAAGT
jgi:hypothetical protein